MTCRNRPNREVGSTTDGRDHVWIVTRFRGECAECGDELPPGAHILWLPGAPRGENNYCAPCGSEIAGSYPPQSYWERRDEEARSRQSAVGG